MKSASCQLDEKRQTGQYQSLSATCRIRERRLAGRDPHDPHLQIQMVAGFSEAVESKDLLVAGGCNHPNLLVLPFSIELVRPAA